MEHLANQPQSFLKTSSDINTEGRANRAFGTSKSSSSSNLQLAPEIPSNSTIETLAEVGESTIQKVGDTNKELKTDGKADSPSLKGRVKSFGSSIKSLLSKPVDKMVSGWNSLSSDTRRNIKIAIIVAVIAVCVIGFIAMAASPGGQAGLVPLAIILFGLAIVAAGAGATGLAMAGNAAANKGKNTDKVEDKKEDNNEGAKGTTQITGPAQKIAVDAIKDLPTAHQQISLRKDDIGKLHDDLDSLEKELNEKDIEHKEAKKALLELETTASANDPRIAEAKRNVSTLGEEVAKIQGRINDKVAEINTAKQELQPFITHRNQVNKEIISLKKQAAAIEAELDKDGRDDIQERKVDTYLMTPSARVAYLTGKNNALDKSQPDYALKSTRLEKEIELAKINEKIETLSAKTTPKNTNELFKQMEATKSQIRQRDQVIKNLESESAKLENEISHINAQLKEAHPTEFNENGTPKQVDANGLVILQDGKVTVRDEALLSELKEHYEGLEIYGSTIENQKQLKADFEKTLANLQMINEGVGKRIGDLEVQRNSVQDQLNAMYGSRDIDQLIRDNEAQLLKLNANEEGLDPTTVEDEMKKVNQSIRNLQSIKENAAPLEFKLENLNGQIKELKGPELVQTAKMYKPVAGQLESPSANIQIPADVLENLSAKPIVADFDMTIQEEVITETDEMTLESLLESLEKGEKVETPRVLTKAEELKNELKALTSEKERLNDRISSLKVAIFENDQYRQDANKVKDGIPLPSKEPILPKFTAKESRSEILDKKAEIERLKNEHKLALNQYNYSMASIGETLERYDQKEIELKKEIASIEHELIGLESKIKIANNQISYENQKEMDDFFKDYPNSSEGATVSSNKSKVTIQKNRETLSQIAEKAVSEYPYSGFDVPGMSIKNASSNGATPAINDNKMNLKKGVVINNIGNVSNNYTWKEQPSLDATIPETIKNAAVHLPKTLSAAEYNEMRKLTQNGVASGTGITAEEAQKTALNLAGIVIEATLPYKAGALLNDGGEDVEMHCIFQTALNFAGVGGGGIPLTDVESASNQIVEYSNKSADAALSSAIRNNSDVLIFNIGMGSGFFGGNYKTDVKEANVNAICRAMENAKQNGAQIEVIVPNIGFNDSQKAALKKAGIQIVAADKDAVAALSARQGLKTSVTIAGDPMSTLGIHGPGFWWETAGSASDEERAAFLTPCYALGHIPIDIHEGDKPPQKVAALSEFMRV